MPQLAAVWKLLKELDGVKIGYSYFGKRPQKINEASMEIKGSESLECLASEVAAKRAYSGTQK